MILLLIALGGALGSVSRYAFGTFVQKTAQVQFPIGTFAVNLVGCALVGALAKYFLHTQTHPQLRAMLIVGFCGGFTTFSAFSLETVGLMQGGEWGKAATYVGMSVLACLLGTAAGFAVVQSR
jgi:fluoride exporter